MQICHAVSYILTHLGEPALVRLPDKADEPLDRTSTIVLRGSDAVVNNV